MKKILLILCFIATSLSLNSCVSDCKHSLYDDVLGRTWVGDLGFSDGRYALESGVKFNGNGFGVDEQCYFDGDKKLFGNFEFQWWIEYDNIFMQYGNNGPNRGPRLELRNVNVNGDSLYCELYVEGRFVNNVRLTMFI